MSRSSLQNWLRPSRNFSICAESSISSKNVSSELKQSPPKCINPSASEARAHYEAALSLFQQVQSRLGQANVYRGLGDLEHHLGQLSEARAHYEAALSLFQQEQDRLGQANVYRGLGELERRLGHLSEARAHYEAALSLFQQVQDRLGQANVYRGLGDLEHHLGHLSEARAHYEAALPLFQQVQSRLGQANVLLSWGNMLLAQKDWQAARDYYQQALPLFVAEREPLGQANTLIDLGRARFELGEQEQGLRDVRQAAVLFRAVHDETWARRAELRGLEMQARMKRPEMEVELFEAFLTVESAQQMFQLVQQRPQLLTDNWLTLIEELISAQESEEIRRVLGERLDTLQELR
jgi:tetratricopeptide (TPR) repeat protein